MSSALLSAHRPRFILAPLLFGFIYTIGTLSFVLLWSGKQFIPGFTDFEQYGLMYAATCLLGAVCNFAILWGHRWGVPGQVLVWIVDAAINILLQRNVASYFGLAFLLVGFWIFDVYRNRHLLVE